MLKFFDRIEDGEHWVGQTLVPWHISIGSLLLLLVVLRIIWAAKQKDTRPVQDPATATLVKIGHFLLYAGMALMPITGVCTMIGNGYGWAPFGIQLVAKSEKISWMASLGGLYSPIAWILLVMIVGHIGIALFHHFVKKDGVLSRMA
ncbi:cytochrome b/b6 domain-containing protein [Paenalcaligenes niemegkensis]|uniref:cytochrome b n=1 Tax=Paenalcaligenes niemegkensis TaxID=2895469 RepID=UPI001EE86BE2|nr:cytochrome b/b6 domain-containing protein [Paenalcaligenes niemegkensis]MCQ9616638.1 cytochrome b/b6 domain-containing protein [Paenalcaligenes niemegkensis]